jgi:LEA14-like dessication related protein
MVVLLLTISMTSCTEYKEVSISSIRNFRVKSLNLTGIEAEIDAGIKNPNALGFKIYKSDCDVFYGTVKLGKAKLTKNVRVGANSDDTHTFLLKADFSNIGYQDIATLLGKSRSNLELKGYIKVGKWFYKKKIPVEKNDVVNLKKLF